MIRSYGDEYLRYLKSNFEIISFTQISHGDRTLSVSNLIIITNLITNSVTLVTNLVINLRATILAILAILANSKLSYKFCYFCESQNRVADLTDFRV